MAPLLQPGDYIVVKQGTPAVLGAGAVVLIRARLQPIAHRVVARHESHGTVHLLTKGDNSEQVDNAVTGADVLGVVVRVVRHGVHLDLSRRHARWLGSGAAYLSALHARAARTPRSLPVRIIARGLRCAICASAWTLWALARRR